MVTLDELMDAGDRRRARTGDTWRVVAGHVRVGLWSAGWALAKLVALLFTCVAGVFFAVGWVAARVVPVLRWMKAAFLLGWEAGRSRGAA